jgi:peptidoglycan/xylan/chitin deacetylase (PgdA/CDA1 family)
MSETPGLHKTSLVRWAIRAATLGISLVVFSLDQIWLNLGRELGLDFPCRCSVLYYHSVPNDFSGRFEHQMRLLLKLAHPLDLRFLSNCSGAERSVAITFDDATESFNEHAVPVLLRLQIPATVFAVADSLGTRPGWGDRYYLPDERVMSETELRSLPDAISVGSHTLTHPSLTALDADRAREEIVGSRRRLEEILLRPVTLFSFPHGHFNDALIQQCREAGYDRVFTTEPKCAHEDNFVIGRVSVDPWDWPLEFRLKMMGAYRWRISARAVFNRMCRTFSFRKQPGNDQAVAWRLNQKSEGNNR